MGAKRLTAVVKIPRAWPEGRTQFEGKLAGTRRAVPFSSNARPDRPIDIVPKAPDMVAWLTSLKADISAIFSLKKGWSGPQSHAVSERSVAKLLLLLIMEIEAYKFRPPQLVPLVTGGIQAEWHYRGQSVEIGITADGEIFAFATDLVGNVVVEIDDSWFIPSGKLAMLRRCLNSLPERQRDT
jgi:hypothetical protein